MKPESVITWKWKPHAGYRSTFGPETVNTLFRMVRRHYPHQFRAICITDDPDGIDPSIETVPLWNDYADVRNPHGHPRNPSCYRRLRAFKGDIGDVLGRRFVTLDLDSVITGDLTPLWDRPEDFVIWGDTNPRTLYNSSMYLLTAGSRSKVWDTFDPDDSPKESRARGQYGSDQGWIGACLGPGEARWTRRDGVYSFRNDIAKDGAAHRLPKDARIVFFHGQHDPWGPVPQSIAWVRESYC
jgi:hypothetical protein